LRQRVGPWQVVDKDRQRPLLGEIHRKPIEPVQHRELVGCCTVSKHWLGKRRRSLHCARPRRGISAHQQRTEQVKNNSEWIVTRQFAAQDAYDADVRCISAVSNCLEEARLADPARPLDQAHLSVANLGAMQDLSELI
jgi:hypothetical protein